MSANTLRSFEFEARVSIAHLAASLPSHSGVLNFANPSDGGIVGRHVPDYLNIATIFDNQHDNDVGINLMGPPIHVRDGDDLSVVVKNSLATTGLSLHWHGFEMTESLPYDGVVGITQCPISPGGTFAYNFTVNETPGTYWYHTHSGELGVDAYNSIKGPLIVHPPEATSEEHWDRVGDNNELGVRALFEENQGRTSYDDLLFYGNERILFFSDGTHHSDSKEYLLRAGGLNPPISQNEDELSVGTFPWGFGTCNGVMREIVPVSPGKRYKFRLINAGNLFALRISMDGFKFTVVAADSEEVEPYEVDEVILHAAERFDVEIDIPADAEIGSTSWIRADTLESHKQGYRNGIRAVLHITDENQEQPAKDEDVLDPTSPIVTQHDSLDRSTMNCVSRYESEQKGPDGSCVPITDLKYRSHKSACENEADCSGSVTASQEFETHTIDFEWSSPPQFAHFTRIDGDRWLQHAHKSSVSMVDPTYDATRDLHPNAAVLNVDSNSTAILVWRTNSMMDHPIHLHGLKSEYN